MRLIDADYIVKTIERAQLESRKVNVLSLINDAPTIEPNTVYDFKGCDNCELERTTGEWIYDEKLCNWKCSNCLETPKTIGYVGSSEFMTEHFKYCNHCGAKMEGEE